MTGILIAAAIRPFVLLLVLWLICWPIKRFTWNALPECRLRRILFFSWKA